MAEVTTTRCHQFTHPEISVAYADRGVIPEDASNLLHSLEDMVANGTVFKPGETIQIGWLYAQFREGGGNVLTIHEPDLQAFPVSWQPGITNILMTKRYQLDVADSFGLREKADFASFRHSCIVCTEFRDGEDFFMSRCAPKGTDSGWFIGCVNEHDHNAIPNLVRVSTYELITCFGRGPLMYLALPENVIVKISGGLPRAGLSDRGLPIQAGSFVEALYTRSGGAV